MTSTYAVLTSHSNRDISVEISKLETSLAEAKLWDEYFTFQLILYKWCFIILREDWGGGVPLYHSYRILSNIKGINLYIWQVGKCPGHPLLNFLDPTLDFISFIKRDLMAHGICVLFNIKNDQKHFTLFIH